MLDELVGRSAAPELVGVALDRLAARRADAADRLRNDPRLGHTVVTVMAASRSLTDLLVTDPTALDVVADLDTRTPVDATSAEALAAWKRCELLRIAARDLTGLDDLEATGGALSSLAADVLQGAVVVTATADVAVIGMGKLAGDELNYASDVDVMFVTDGNEIGAAEGARAVLAVARRCFTVDADLRPEGPQGPLVRTLSSYRSYWDRWAEAWEFQALLKARPVAGPEALGDAWAEAAAGCLWSRDLDASAFDQIRAIKSRGEALLAGKGRSEAEIKRGTGGIRDIEFSAQILQLAYGRHDPTVRVPGTLAALDALVAGDYIDTADAETLEDGYRFLRALEHRLQLVQERQTHTLPTDAAARRRLAAVLGFDDVAAFDRRLAGVRAAVREVHERIYHRRRLDGFTGPGGPAIGIDAQVEAAVDRWLAASPDEATGRLVTERLGPSAIRAAGRDDPEALYRWCRIAGTSRATAEALLDDPDPLATLGALEEHLDADPLAGAPSLRIGKRRGQAVIAAADLVGLLDVDEVGRRLGTLADRVVTAGLAEVDPPLPFVVIALGRYGGQELSYGSDLDLAFAYDGGTPEDQQQAEQAARALRDLIGRKGPHQIYEVDLNLRPEGAKGALARSLNGFRTYYELWADPWELQAMIRARIVAGDEATAHGFVLAIAPHVWGAPPTDEAIAQIRHIKRRIETEKLPEGVAAERHLKVGPGGLIDVEFTTQLMQLRTGARGRGTIEALANLRRQRFIGAGDADALATAYRSCLRLRNRLWLLGARRYDEFPEPGPDLDALSTSLSRNPQELVSEHLAATSAARDVVRRLFNGEE